MFTTVERSASGVRLIDQRRLPLEEAYLDCTSVEDVARAIREMVVRGAPAIGVTAAFGIALGATQAAAAGGDRAAFEQRLTEIGRLLVATRPTAVNLHWAVERMREAWRQALARDLGPPDVARLLEREAQRICDEDLESCRAIGRHGAALVPDTASILTHCNAGGLATAGYGTALGVVRRAVADGKRVRVLADETRPFLQGARLTLWELMHDGIETELIGDSAAGSLMRRGEVDLVLVGADRIAANGDVANKIGTYGVAVLARENGVPFYVAAPLSTVDFACADGNGIPIEERDPRELTEWLGVQLAPHGARARNPAFDVTPARYVGAIVTERGLARPPYEASLALLRDAPPDASR